MNFNKSRYVGRIKKQIIPRVNLTAGILRSIRIRDMLYKKVKNTSINSPSYEVLKTTLKQYNMILKIIINNAKYCYFQKLFNNHNNNIKKTWDNIRLIINNSPKNNILPKFVINDNNICVTNKTEIANEFNKFFTNIGPCQK